jgi:hypothetical protein
LHHPSSHSQIFPYQTDFTSLADSTTTHHIEYESQPISDKLVFFGKLSNGDSVCIKFTRSYSQDAHSFCSSIGAAPELLGFQPIAGGWWMVVMARIGPDYHEFHQLPRDPEILKKLGSILTQLHRKNLVHGDVRDTNIMVRGKDVKLIDFDWAGEIGVVQYPMNVFRGDGLWLPAGACDGELITTEHDIEMLKHL